MKWGTDARPPVVRHVRSIEDWHERGEDLVIELAPARAM